MHGKKFRFRFQTLSKNDLFLAELFHFFARATARGECITWPVCLSVCLFVTVSTLAELIFALFLKIQKGCDELKKKVS